MQFCEESDDRLFKILIFELELFLMLIIGGPKLHKGIY